MGDPIEITGAIRTSNRRAFRQLIGVIAEYIEQDYEKVEIWRYLVGQGKLSISYPQFTKYVRRYVLGNVSGKVIRQGSGEEAQKTFAQKIQPSRAAEPDSSKNSESKRTFNHSSKAKDLREFAHGKKEKPDDLQDVSAPAES